MRKVEGAVPVIGMTVVPADKLGRRIRAGEIDARDVQFPVGRWPTGEDDRIIVGAEFLDREIDSNFYVSSEVKAFMLCDLLIGLDDVLDLLMVGSDVSPHETTRSRQAIVHVGVDCQARLEECLGGVKTARSATDNRNPQCSSACSKFGHTRIPPSAMLCFRRRSFRKGS